MGAGQENRGQEGYLRWQRKGLEVVQVLKGWVGSGRNRGNCGRSHS